MLREFKNLNDKSLAHRLESVPQCIAKCERMLAEELASDDCWDECVTNIRNEIAGFERDLAAYKEEKSIREANT